MSYATKQGIYYSLLFYSLTEKTEEMATSFYMTFQWKDPRLTWDSCEFEGIKQIRVPSQAIWKPDMSLLNT